MSVEIQSLVNLKTKYYIHLKRVILGDNFDWKYTASREVDRTHGKYKHDEYYGHTFITRPRPRSGKYLPEACSPFTELALKVIQEISDENNLDIVTLHRVCANCHHPQEVQRAVTHTDHYFPHRNMLIYLTDAGGDTVIEEEDGTQHVIEAEEDKIVMFTGHHFFYTPKTKRRVNFVCTFNAEYNENNFAGNHYD